MAAFRQVGSAWSGFDLLVIGNYLDQRSFQMPGERKVALPDIFFQFFLLIAKDVEELLFTINFGSAAIEKKEVSVDLEILGLFVRGGWKQEILSCPGKKGDMGAGVELLIKPRFRQIG